MWRRFKLFIVLVAFEFLYPLLAVAGVIGSGDEVPEALDWRYFLWPAVAAFIVLVTYVSARRAFATNKLMCQLVRFTFTAAGIEVSGPLSSGKCSWEGIQRGEETRSMFLLWVSKQQAYLVPKRYFTEQPARDRFRSLVARQLGSRAKLRFGA